MKKTFALLLIFWLAPSLYAEDIFNDTFQPTPSLADHNITELQQALVFYQNAASQHWQHIPTNTHFKLGKKNNTVFLLRTRLKLTGDLHSQSDLGTKTYDTLLADAVKNFQIRHGLKVDGIAGTNTITQLNIPLEQRIQQIQVNLQRWEILAKQLGKRFVLVNIPDYHLYLIENNQQVLSMKAIVGKENLPTPQLSSRITRIVLNPPWNIPPKIARKEIAKKMLEDPGYLEKMNIRVFNEDEYYYDNQNALPIEPSMINWNIAAKEGLGHYLLRQDPGPESALGLVKFEFQNSHDVYLHDTPTKDLFNNNMRSMSHGCVRLEKPFELVTYLLKDDNNWDAERIQDVLDTGNTKYVRIPNPLPIVITYLTSWVDAEGRVNFRDDVYNLDQ